MQPMPQSICAIVCIYVCFGPTQRLLPGVSIYSLYTNCCSCSSPRRVVSPSALSSLSDSSPPVHVWFHYSKDDPIPPITVSSRFSPSTGCPHMPDVISLSDPRQRRRKYQDWWTSLRFESVAFFIFSNSPTLCRKILFQNSFLACSPVIEISNCVLRIFIACHGSYICRGVRTTLFVSAIWTFVGSLQRSGWNGTGWVSFTSTLIIFISNLHCF